MNFIRKKKRGQNQKVRKTWFSEEGYRITWRKEIYGVQVPARYQACVRMLVPYSDGQLRPVWDFVNRSHRLIKTLKKAEKECEKHKRLWTKAIEAAGVRALKELFGKLPFGLPLWTRKKLNRRLYTILTNNQPAKYRNDESCTASGSDASGSDASGSDASGSDASGFDASGSDDFIKISEPSAASTKMASTEGNSTTRRTRHTRSKNAETRHVEKAAKTRKKPAAKRTKRTKRTKHTKRPKHTKHNKHNASCELEL
jgi:hypothetical protein